MPASRAPLALFIYNRPHYLKRTLESLSKNELISETELFVYCDGPKENVSDDDLKKIEECREIVKQINWVKKKTIIERESNMGLGESVIAGVTEVIQKHKRIIVLEDDVITSPFFLKFVNSALVMYEQDKQVFSIGTWNYFATSRKIPDCFFLPVTDTIAWATWSDRWGEFEPDPVKLLEQIDSKGLKESFNLFGNYDFYTMLKNQIAGKVSSWGIRWYATGFLKGGLTLYPKHSVTDHIGVDVMATHAVGFDVSDQVKFPEKEISVKKIPLIVNPKILELLINAYSKISNHTYHKPSLPVRIWNRLKRL
jgi:GT2 family glycosyltransferase